MDTPETRENLLALLRAYDTLRAPRPIPSLQVGMPAVADPEDAVEIRKLILANAKQLAPKELTSGCTGAGQPEQRVVVAGTTLKINGIPVVLLQDTVVETLPSNWELIGKG